MAKIVSFHLEGVGETIENLRRLSAEERQAMRSVVEESARTIHAQARARAPVGTGRLRSSIRLRTLEEGLAAVVGPTARWGAIMEFGSGPLGAATNRQTLPSWYRHKIPYPFPAWKKPQFQAWARRHGLSPFKVALGLFRHQGIPARPYLFPAFEAERERFVANLRSAIGEAIRKVAV